jgi:hypothetical protein
VRIEARLAFWGAIIAGGRRRADADLRNVRSQGASVFKKFLRQTLLRFNAPHIQRTAGLTHRMGRAGGAGNRLGCPVPEALPQAGINRAVGPKTPRHAAIAYVPLIHVIFSTKDRAPIFDPCVRPAIQAYLATVTNRWRAGSMPMGNLHEVSRQVAACRENPTSEGHSCSSKPQTPKLDPVGFPKPTQMYRQAASAGKLWGLPTRRFAARWQHESS